MCHYNIRHPLNISGVMYALLFCARISVTHRSKEKIPNRRAERKSSEIFGFGCVEHKLYLKKITNRQTWQQKYYQILYRARKLLLWIVCKRGRWFKRKFTIAYFGHSVNNMKEYDWTSLFGVILSIQLVKNLSYWIKRTKGIPNYSIRYQNLYLIVSFLQYNDDFFFEVNTFL